VLTASSTGLLQRTITSLQSEFAMKDLGKLHHFLGMCRIAIAASPPGVYPAVEFQDGDLRTKNLMVTRRRRDLDRFGPR